MASTLIVAPGGCRYKPLGDDQTDGLRALDGFVPRMGVGSVPPVVGGDGRLGVPQPSSRIEVDLSAITHNVGVIRRVLSRGREGQRSPALCAVLKADGYGLGAARIARRLAGLGVEMVAVYTTDQARALVESNVTTPILVLMPVREIERSDALYRAASRGRLHLAIHDAANLATVSEIADRQGMTLPVHVEVDTGMSRGGVSPADATVLLERIERHARLRLAGVFTHFASANLNDEQTREQSEIFSKWLESVRHLIPDDCVVHQANTFAMFRSSVLHRDMVRVGLAVLGFAGEEFADDGAFELREDAERLRPCVRWLSSVVHVKTIEAGTPVGYAGTWRAPRRTRIALVPVGYADGYPLALSNKARVGVVLPDGRTAYAPVVGRVSMDQITIDVTELPGDFVSIGSVVEVIGAERGTPTHLPTLAQQAGTISHELLCRLSHRLPRFYTALDASESKQQTNERSSLGVELPAVESKTTRPAN